MSCSCFSSFLAVSVFLPQIPFSKFQDRTFLRFGAMIRVLEQILGQEKVFFSCGRSSSIVFCNLLLANRIGMIPSVLLCIVAAHLVLLSFATRCLQIAFGVAAPKIAMMSCW